jgi:hypothetical protein
LVRSEQDAELAQLDAKIKQAALQKGFRWSPLKVPKVNLDGTPRKPWSKRGTS